MYSCGVTHLNILTCTLSTLQTQPNVNANLREGSPWACGDSYCIDMLSPQRCRIWYVGGPTEERPGVSLERERMWKEGPRIAWDL